MRRFALIELECSDCLYPLQDGSELRLAQSFTGAFGEKDALRILGLRELCTAFDRLGERGTDLKSALREFDGGGDQVLPFGASIF